MSQTHTVVADVQSVVVNTHAIVSDVRQGVVNAQNVILGVHQDVVNTQAITSALRHNVSDIHRIIVRGQEAADDKSFSVSVTCTLFVAERTLTVV